MFYLKFYHLVLNDIDLKGFPLEEKLQPEGNSCSFTLSNVGNSNNGSMYLLNTTNNTVII